MNLKFTKTDMRHWGTRRLLDFRKDLTVEQRSQKDEARLEDIGYMLQSINEILAKRGQL